MRLLLAIDAEEKHQSKLPGGQEVSKMTMLSLSLNKMTMISYVRRPTTNGIVRPNIVSVLLLSFPLFANSDPFQLLS